MLTSNVSVVNIGVRHYNAPKKNPAMSARKPDTRTDTKPTQATGRHRGYHHGDLRQALIDEAVNYLKENSADSLSLRALARAVGVSQTAPYRHFPARSDLFVAIALQGFEQLTGYLRSARDAESDTGAAFIATGLAYVQWSVEHPETYQLFFDSKLLDFSEDPQLIDAGARTFEVMLALIRRGQTEGFFRTDKPTEELAGLIWAGVHGMSSLAQKHRMQTAKGHAADSVALALAGLTDNRADVLQLLMQSIRA
ncbi:MAG: TetR/AcrR family transcriptional regulator [Pseudomonadales bacterium]|nr:TetR/AcrR family transcriptional regulator [Pseudomonadales bacterium]